MPILKTGQPFTSGDQVTSQKLMDIADLATFDDPADGQTIIVNSQTYGISGGDGKLKVPSGGITSNELATNSVTRDKILDGEVTSAKLNADTISILVPTAIVLPFAGANAPQGFLFCAGQTLLVADYSDLHDAIGYTYGGSGSSFNIPDLRGRVVAGQDDMGGDSANRLTNQSGGLNGDTLGATGGFETNTLTIAEMPAHTHDVTTGSASNNQNGVPGNVPKGSNNTSPTTAPYSNGAPSTGGGSAHNNVQPTIILNYIIKT